MSEYEAFIEAKLATIPPRGLDAIPELHPSLFPFQRDLVSWALRRGRAALMCDTGLGKTRQQIEWARCVAEHIGPDAHIMILAPLAVAAQTVAEGASIGVAVNLCRESTDVRPGLNITNYDRIHKFDASRFDGVVLDESSIIKHHDAKTLRTLLDAFSRTAFKLCCTATPAPNDWTELGTHAEFLGICSRTEMLSEYFVHDGGDTSVWRLKGHARAAFWKWVSTWGALVRRPSDLGYDDDAYSLPKLIVNQHVIESDASAVAKRGLLFEVEAQDLMARRQARSASIDGRVKACADRVNSEPDEPWIVWCDLNRESEALRDAIPGSVEVRGSMSTDEKEAALRGFADGSIRVLVTKSSIAGFGLNWQHCARMAFVGVTDSWESYYQSVRRCWRFGQLRDVVVWLFSSAAEGAVIANLARKDREAAKMADALSAETREIVRSEVRALRRESNAYLAHREIKIPEWLKSED